MSDEVRLAPGTREDIGLINHVIARGLGMAQGSSGPPNIFTTLARHRGLFRRWLAFAGTLMPGGSLPRRDSELLILRVAHNTGCDYEWRHHERLGAEAGLSADEIARVRSGPADPGWDAHAALLLRAADELHADRRIGDSTWAELAAAHKPHELIELCMLVGHYEMLAMTLNSAGTPLDTLSPGPPARVVRLVHAALARRR